MRGTKRRTLSVVAAVAMVLALAPALAVADDHTNDDGGANGVVNWEGHGSEELPCPGGIHWIFTAGDVDSATLTFNGATYEPTKHVGAIHFETTGAMAAEEIDAFVTYTGESKKGQMILTISNCLEGEEPEVGDLEVVKTVEGDEAPADATFDFTVVCTDGTDESFTLAHGESELIAGIAAGAECTVTEVGTGGADTVLVDGTEGDSATVVIVADEMATVSFTNVFDDEVVPEVGDLEVVKTVEGDEAPADATFDFTVVCDDGTDESFTLADGESELITGIAAGAECTVTEVGTGGADTVMVDGTEGDSATVVIVADEMATVSFTNVFDDEVVPEVGDLEVVKTVEGDDAPADATFGFTVVCDDGTDESFTLADGESEEILGIVAGSECTVTETGTGGADTVMVDGAEGDETTVMIVADEMVGVAFTNIWEDVDVLPEAFGDLQVVKTVEGDDAPADATFDFTVVCDDGTDESFTLADGESEEILGIVAGSECTVTETDTGGADTVMVDGTEGDEAMVVIVADEMVGVAFTNIWEDVAVQPGGEVAPTQPAARPAVPTGVLGVTQRAGAGPAVGALAVTGVDTRDALALGLLTLLFGAALLCTGRRATGRGRGGATD